MRPIRSLLVFLVVVFLGGALLAPWLYWLAQAVTPHSHLAASPFHRFVNRSLLLLALLGIWPLLRDLGAKSWRDVGIVSLAGQWLNLAAGLMLGFCSLACAVMIVLVARSRQFDLNLTAAQFAGKLAGSIGTAVVVAVLEELLFRGAIFGALRKIWDWRLALLVSSMIYAIVHFMESAHLDGPVTWESGLVLLPRMLAGFGHWQAIVPGFFNLTLAGVILGLAYQRTGNLYLSIGLHAGWIFWLKSYGLVTVQFSDAHLWFWGTQKLIDGWLAFIVLALTFAILLRLPPANDEPAA